jgi:hypothetical protein
MAKPASVVGAVWESPTATQAQSVTQDSPNSVVDSVPWFGVPLTIDHEVPFQVRAKVAGESPEAAVAEPTALHVV